MHCFAWFWLAISIKTASLAYECTNVRDHFYYQRVAKLANEYNKMGFWLRIVWYICIVWYILNKSSRLAPNRNNGDITILMHSVCIRTSLMYGETMKVIDDNWWYTHLGAESFWFKVSFSPYQYSGALRLRRSTYRGAAIKDKKRNTVLWVCSY